MIPTPIPEHDKDYLLLSEIDANCDISQRELSQKTGLSLGTVNLLIQKMIREGLIKMDMIPANRVIYMLTPKGLAEKAEKTVRYVRNHYNAIQNTKGRILKKLDHHSLQFEKVIVCMPQSELKDLVRVTVEEYLREKPLANVMMANRNEIAVMEADQQKTIVLYLPEEHAKIISTIEPRKFEMDMLI